MAHPDVVAAVRDRLANGFDACAIYAENSFSEPPKDGKPFIVVQFPYSRTEWLTVEGPDGCDFLEEGAALLVLHLRRGAGAERGRAWLERIAQLFRGQEFAGVQCFAPDAPASDDGNDKPGWYRLRMAVPYQFVSG